MLDFDHLDDKVANVVDMPGKFGWDKIQKEIDKCDLICSNCHRRRTYERKRSVA